MLIRNDNGIHYLEREYAQTNEQFICRVHVFSVLSPGAGVKKEGRKRKRKQNTQLVFHQVRAS